MLRNQVQLIGRLGKDPEVKQFEDGKTKASMSVATNGYYLDKEGERVENTQWHHVVTWGNNAKIAEKYLKKGSELAVQGRLEYYSYDDKEGQKKYGTEVVALEVVLLGKAPKND